ncbi:hypothetical protein MSG28_005727 [Choristoneura fumiferana]|uniref:Uncharacterized protein n=1 Tax=Choristoneura fumiferana TaxID=7141 RepID=A0ACC0L0H3_CHOFU|nr:hypothetical protein MSG28_005727 [Choristoneura fumiferana]
MSNLIKANVASVTRMTGLALPGMVKRGKGVIINIGSASSIIPSPLLTVYAASKAYVDKFTEGLDMEYRKKGIICQCVMPGFVCTTMSGIRRSTFFAPTAEAFVKSAISLVGTVSRTTGYLPHAIFTNTISFIYDVSGSFGVWLVTRSMENTQKEFKVSTKIIQADFCEGEEIYATIAKEITDLEIGTLVNNVGISYSYPEYFLDANVASVTRMTGLALPGMVKRGKGVIINIGSASSIIPSPLLTVYAASKAYVDKFTEGLDMEYRKKGIICQCVMPGFVCTTMSGIRRSTFFAPTAEAFVKSAISLVGTVSRTTGYLPHAIFTNTISFIYDVSGSFGVWLVTRSMENTRNRSLKKYKKQ